ncbi:TPA: DUF2975 domain-containing protein [Candidatus Wolfebacteria bacterium]|uniref:DUF2975 domain-containing protein n=2 Tax=Candidatus Wolfeibacteriota TaxID=1752735 RepID=A0A0G1X646_9BACT|nr:MAG: hypothetical protein UX70_C0001G0993 [Candidatus Wolfebacteria bacterium GW2011_GWB1_47_1]KKU59385.1 MAG: hypothetical protein UX83_C0005G0004 [Candidatus Wolfebacteria bacterium GW2011_GWE2_47_12]KKU65578.1 MAG: hypothetical protein UX90_C0003G0040 [Candidatus Wolfebacteria bacterium GW2011_GWD2_47_17]KKU89895.1 MAG: hypothetical protein UY19_C0008G0049 [Candidatus Wolfebacteria bacterium GW2011_GWA2_47_9b]HAS95727.1 DUF2975 domain-containing protein [Candidatus Wolfebacteria bacterium
MKRGSTNFLRFTVYVMGSIVLALCIFALPEMWQGGSVEFPMVDYAIFLIMMGMYVTAVPFFIALWQTLKLLTYIDQNKAFSELSVKALRNIKRCAAIIAVLYVGGVPLLFPIADAEDAPGMLIIGMIIACAPITVAVFAAVLQKLLQSAIDIKSENDLTV